MEGISASFDDRKADGESWLCAALKSKRERKYSKNVEAP
jgi:hypothetical protein